MKFGYTIIYVPDVAASLAFFKLAFGIEPRFLHESGDYGELATGETALAFASHGLGHLNLPGGHVEAHSAIKPLGIEIALVTPDVASAHARAIAAGAIELSSPTEKPWGQTVSYVRCPDGALVELCTPIVQ
ncbi:VOC family protein [bacterium]|nr:VOC family protein [bacterium]